MPATTPPIDQFLYHEYGSAIFPLLFPSNAQLAPATTTREVTHRPTAATAGSTSSGAFTDSDRQRGSLTQRAKMTLSHAVSKALAKVKCGGGHDVEPDRKRRHSSVPDSAWSEWEMVTDGGARQ